VGTRIANSGDDQSTGRGSPKTDMGVPYNLPFTTPDSSTLNFLASIDRKTKFATSVMELSDAESTDPKSMTILGANL
jgi:hypothetical protein